MNMTTTTGRIEGGRVLAPDGGILHDGVVEWSGETITAVDTEVRGGDVIDATGCWVLPGVVDIHGDAFERSLMPRPGVSVPAEAALADNDTQLLAAGVTTSFLSATDSWEPGLRSRDTLRSLVAALSHRGAQTPDVRLHVRHERCATDNIDELGGWIDDGTVRFLSYNDHTPGGIAMVTGASDGQVKRSGVDRPTFEALMAEAIERRPVGAAHEQELAHSARSAGCPTASHDPSSAEDLARDLELGVAVAEFPLGIPLAQQYREEGLGVLLGAPNLVRGSSHLGNLSVRDAVAAGAVSMLCSDYHYPSLLNAPFVAAAVGLMDLPQAWPLVSSAPAAAAGLTDRGTLAPGARADVIVVEPPTDPSGAAVVKAVVCAGTVAMTRS